MLEWRLARFRRGSLRSPTGPVNHAPIDYQDIYYYAAPKRRAGPMSLDEVDPEVLATYAKLGIPLREQEVLAGVQSEAGDIFYFLYLIIYDSLRRKLRSTRCSTPFRWSPPSRPNWPRPA